MSEADEIAEDLEFSIMQDGNAITARAKYPRRSGSTGENRSRGVFHGAGSGAL